LHALTTAPASADTLIGAGIAAVKAGDKTQAYDLLTQALAAEPRHELGWLWLSGVAAGDAERYYCLEQVLTINPHNAAAQRGLSLLPRGVVPVSPLPSSPPDPPPAPQPEPAVIPAASQIDPLAALSVLAAPASQTLSLGLPKLSALAPAEPPSATAMPEPAAVSQPAPAAAARHPDIEIVVRALGANKTADEVSRMLCEQHGYAWPDAQDLVARAQQQHRTTIARRQAPFLIFLGVATLLGGLGLLGFAVLRFTALSSGVYTYSPYFYRNMIVAFGSGSLMVLGSTIGLAQVLRSMWK
jgi:hypothetical protein